MDDNYTKGIIDLITERRAEALDACYWPTTDKFVRSLLSESSSLPVPSIKAGKTFASLDALRQLQAAATTAPPASVFNSSTYSQPLSNPTFDPFYVSRQQFQYTYTMQLHPATYQSILYGDTAFKQVAAGRFGDTEYDPPPEENSCTKVFIYSERTNRMYKDRMRFWLVNPFKDDILACAETNS